MTTNVEVAKIGEIRGSEDIQKKSYKISYYGDGRKISGTVKTVEPSCGDGKAG